MARTPSLFTRVISGVAAMAPVIVIVAVVLIIAGGGRSRVPVAMLGVVAGAIGHVMYMIALAWFLHSVSHDDSVDSAERERWTSFMLMGFPFGAIAYWYRHVWRIGHN
jgi:hypothetical protein